jgi:hypothetical protein
MHHIGLKTWTYNARIAKQDKAESNQYKLGKRVLHELNIKQKLKATRDNLMNLLDLAKSNRADN